MAPSGEHPLASDAPVTRSELQALVNAMGTEMHQTLSSTLSNELNRRTQELSNSTTAAQTNLTTQLTTLRDQMMDALQTANTAAAARQNKLDETLRTYQAESTADRHAFSERLTAERAEFQTQLQQFLTTAQTAFASREPLASLSTGAALADTPDPDRRKPLPDPPLWDGSRKTFASWLNAMEHKTNRDRCFIGDDADTWYYVDNRIAPGDAKNIVSAFVQSGGTSGARQPSELYAYLKRQFGNHSERQEAGNRLFTLQQGNQQFTLFHCYGLTAQFMA